MPEEPRNVYPTAHLAAQLGVGTSMARRYGLTLENVRGQPLPQVPGRGRVYTDEDVRVLVDARNLLVQEPNRTLDDVLRQVLGIQPPPESLAVTGGNDDPQGAAAARRRATAAEIQRALAPVLNAIQQLHVQNEQLRDEVRALKSLPAPTGGAEDPQRLLELYRQQMLAKDEELERLRHRPWWRFWG